MDVHAPQSGPHTSVQRGPQEASPGSAFREEDPGQPAWNGPLGLICCVEGAVSKNMGVWQS